MHNDIQRHQCFILPPEKSRKTEQYQKIKAAVSNRNTASMPALSHNAKFPFGFAPLHRVGDGTR
jgi:hypothetical protein